MEKGDKGSTMIRMGVSGWMFLLVPAYPGCPGSKAVKRSLLLLLSVKAIQINTYVNYNTVKDHHLRLEAAFTDLTSCCKTQQHFQYSLSPYTTPQVNNSMGIGFRLFKWLMHTVSKFQLCRLFSIKKVSLSVADLNTHLIQCKLSSVVNSHICNITWVCWLLKWCKLMSVCNVDVHACGDVTVCLTS